MADDNSLLSGFYSLSQPVNKAPSNEDSVVSELLPELTLDMEDEELIELKRDWIKVWEPYKMEMEKKQTENENYWLGQQFSATNEKRKMQDNIIFESLETFLPIASRPKADPLVEADNSPEGRAIADKVRKMLSYLSDTLSYNLKLKQVIRYWALYHLGVMKVGWSMKENDITCLAIRPQKLILDPSATIDQGEYSGYYIGEILEDMASDLVARFPDKKEFITDKVQQKMGTTVEYVMWTTDDYVFWTLEDEVLAKNKNPHWNYDTEQAQGLDDYGQQPTEETGEPKTQTIAGKNHFRNRKKPYVFLTFFNLGKHPHDDTNLIQQNIPLQDLINKRLRQIDKNADQANGGMVVSGDAFTEEQAGKAAKALRNGGVVWVPTGDPRTVVLRDSGQQLPAFIYQSLQDYRGELRNIFGIRGSSPQGLSGERTVRGKMFMQQQDQSRIGGGISVNLEEFTDSIFNWWVQLMYVYYDEPHIASILGKEKTQEYIQLSNQELGVNLLVGVKEDSMVPHDPVSERQEALQLWSEKGIDPITFFERLDFPNPRESAKNLFIWLSDPIQLFPDLAQAQAQQQPPPEKPNVTINYKDVQPQGQTQILSQIGVHVDPQTILDHNASQQTQEHAKGTTDAQRQAILAGQAHQHSLQKAQMEGLIKSHLQLTKPQPEPKPSNFVPGNAYD